MGSIFASAVGVQKQANRERDFANGKPVHYVIGGMILTALYLPVTLMLFGSLVASVSQCWMLGAYIMGLESSFTSTAFSLLVAVTLPSVYILLGAWW